MRTLLQSCLVASLVCGTAYAQNVIIFDDQGTQDSVATVLSQAGVTVTAGGHYWHFAGGVDLDEYDLVIFLNGVAWTSQMPTAGQEALREYVGNGGTMLTTEWISWSGATTAVINEILPIAYGGSWSTGSEEYYKKSEHPITSNLPDTFSVPANWSFSVTNVDPVEEKEATVLFEGSRSNAAIVIGRYEEGTLIHWNMGGHYSGADIWTDEVRQLLVNIALYPEFSPTSSELTPEIPQTVSLGQNYPNPFNPQTKIAFELDAPGEVLLTVFDMLGRHVTTLAGGIHAAGRHEVSFQPLGQPSGTYFYRLQAGDQSLTRKMIYLK